MSAQLAPSPAVLTTNFDYLDPSSPDRPAFDFHNGSRTTLRTQSVNAPIIDARTLSDPPRLEREGFTLLQHKTSITLDDDKAKIDQVYHAELGKYLGDLFGAYLVIPFRIGLLIRRPPSDRVYTEQMKGTRIAHLDYTDKAMAQWVPIVSQMEGVNPGFYKRMAIYQTWRMMKAPPQNETLAFCDARSFTAQDSMVFDSIISTDDRQTFESRVMRSRDYYRWMYWHNLTPEEVVVFKGYDTDATRVCDVPHQAITDPQAPSNANLRESIETRFFLFFR